MAGTWTWHACLRLFPLCPRIKTEVFTMAQRASLNCPPSFSSPICGSPFLPSLVTLIGCDHLNPHVGLYHRPLLHHVPPRSSKLPLAQPTWPIHTSPVQFSTAKPPSQSVFHPNVSSIKVATLSFEPCCPRYSLPFYTPTF